jgi:hypothetical protein
MFFGERPETGTAARSRSRIPPSRQGAGIPLKRRPNDKGIKAIYVCASHADSHFNVPAGMRRARGSGVSVAMRCEVKVGGRERCVKIGYCKRVLSKGKVQGGK